jgi:hypothetical protein
MRFIRVFQEIIPHQKRLGRKFGKQNPKKMSTGFENQK